MRLFSAASETIHGASGSYAGFYMYVKVNKTLHLWLIFPYIHFGEIKYSVLFVGLWTIEVPAHTKGMGSGRANQHSASCRFHFSSYPNHTLLFQLGGLAVTLRQDAIDSRHVGYP